MSVVAAIVQAEKGDKIDADPTHTTWSKPVVVVTTNEADRWHVPFGDDWFFRDVVIEVAGNNEYCVTIDADGEARIYGEYNGAERHIGKLTGAEKVGEVSAEKMLRLSEPDEIGLSAIGERRAL
jgi:hypothetical protein